MIAGSIIIANIFILLFYSIIITRKFYFYLTLFCKFFPQKQTTHPLFFWKSLGRSFDTNVTSLYYLPYSNS
jgi:hypothetical protein